jgi:hypothetical protein
LDEGGRREVRVKTAQVPFLERVMGEDEAVGDSGRKLVQEISG